MAQNNNDIETDAGGSAKGLLIIGLLGGLVIGGGVAYFYANSQQQATDQDDTSQKVAVKNQAPLQSVRFDRLTVPIYTNRSGSPRFIGNFFINIEVLVRSDTNLIAVRRSEPQLQHAFISAISKSDLMQEGSNQQLDLEKTAEILKNKANEVLSGNIVEAVSVVEAMRISN